MEANVYIEGDVQAIADRVREYDPNLKLKFLNPNLAEVSDAPYALYEVCKDGKERLVFYIWELDARVLERIYACDMQKQNILAALDDKNAKIKAEENRRYQDKRDEDIDVIKHVVASKKSDYTIKRENKLITISDYKPSETKVIE